MAFRGTAREYFGIWLTNIVLTILTLGIYSAWADVRTRRYFYGNTILDGETLDYTAKPISLLKGRAIVFGVILAAAIGNHVFPGIDVFWLLIPVIPWILAAP